MMPFFRRSNAVLVPVFALLLSVVACGVRSEASASIQPADARALVAAGATLLDVRTPGEWASGHLDGAVLVPIQELEGRMTELARDRPVVVYCASGGRSASATATLRRAGFDARDLGGMHRWSEP